MTSFSGLCFTFFCFVLLANDSFAQISGNYRKDSIDLARIPEMHIVLDSNATHQQATPVIFKSIAVEDVRYDTTQVGIYSIFTSGFTPAVKNYKINLPDGLTHSVDHYLNSFFTPTPSAGDMELVCFIKTLSFAFRDTVVENESTNGKYGQLNFEVEVFLRSGSNYYAAIKIDTVFYATINTRKKQITDEMRHFFLMPALRLLQHQIADTKWENITGRKAFTERVVRDHYLTERFNLPVLAQIQKKGIYRSFAEFKNNMPYIQNFKVKEGKFNTILLTDNKGDNIPTLKSFGFCDGEKYWILWGNYSFPLFRVGNGFEFFLNFSNKVKILSTLNMESGKVY